MAETFKQVRLTDRGVTASQGLGHPAPPGQVTYDFPFEPIASIGSAPEELARRFGLSFEQSFDQLDDLEIALVELGSGQPVALVHHRGSPAQETAIWVGQRGLTDIDRSLATIRLAFDLSPDELTWQRLGPYPGVTYHGTPARHMLSRVGQGLRRLWCQARGAARLP